MPERTGIGPAAAVPLAALLAALNAGAAHAASSGQDFAQIERGRYVALAADCDACHRDPVSRQPYAGGLPIETPFGNVIAPNITPDRDTGIGGWTDAQFEAALRHGRRPDGKRLYPAMPFTYFAKMTAGDVADLHAYLDSLEPVHHAVAADQLPFPFDIRAGMIAWDALFFADAPFVPNASKSAEWNRGAYLVQGPGHCGACHTPKNLLGGDERAQYLQGYSIQGWFAPDLTNTRGGIGDWSCGDLVDYLKTGHNRFAAASGPMAEEVRYSSSQLRPEDLRAMASYLKSQGGHDVARKPLSTNDPAMATGAAIYGDLCAACHKVDGSGVPRLIPNLAASASVGAREPTTVIRVLLEGANSVATDAEPTAPQMPTFAWQLSDAQIAAVGTYIRNSWSHAAPAITAHQVHEERANLSAARPADD